jgi:CBS domain-containing protein
MYAFLEFQVRDFMSRSGVTIGPHTSLEEAERLFERHDFNLLPVVADEKLIGVLTKTDFLRAFSFRSGVLIPPYREILQRDVASVMTPEPTTVAPDMPLPRLLEKMIDTSHRSFPVAEDGRLVGIISREDVICALRQSGAWKDRKTASA